MATALVWGGGGGGGRQGGVERYLRVRQDFWSKMRVIRMPHTSIISVCSKV